MAVACWWTGGPQLRTRHQTPYKKTNIFIDGAFEPTTVAAKQS